METNTLCGGVLIVDDHPDHCRALSLLLQRRGLEVNYVESGPAAMDYIRSQPPQLVLLDVMMPEMSGLDVLRTLRLNPALDAVRVCMYSAVDDAGWREEARRLGADGYLVKGNFGLEELFGRIERYLAPPE
jgi:CheY-like chemotaxis protein